MDLSAAPSTFEIRGQLRAKASPTPALLRNEKGPVQRLLLSRAQHAARSVEEPIPPGTGRVLERQLGEHADVVAADVGAKNGDTAQRAGLLVLLQPVEQPLKASVGTLTQDVFHELAARVRHAAEKRA